MMGRVAHLSLHLYPLAFRRRYEQEMRALLEVADPGTGTVVNLLRGAFMAHLRPTHALLPEDRLRLSVSGVLACWVAFAAAGFGYYKTTEDPPFAHAGAAHDVLGVAHLGIQLCAILASLAVIIGSLPLILAALAHARHQRGGPRLLICIPPAAVVVFAGLTALLVWLAHSGAAHHATALDHGAFIAWELAGVVCGGLCVVAARMALLRTPISRGSLVGAFVGGVVVTVAMLTMAVLAALYAVALPLDASPLAAASNGPLSLTSTEVSLVVQWCVMSLMSALAAGSIRRSYSALGHSRPAFGAHL
jgi:hypothetical protein